MLWKLTVELTSNTIFFSQGLLLRNKSKTKQTNYQVQVKIRGRQTVQGFQNKPHNQKANNLDSKPCTLAKIKSKAGQWL